MFWGLLEADCSQNQEEHAWPEYFREEQDLKRETKTILVIQKKEKEKKKNLVAHNLSLNTF